MAVRYLAARIAGATVEARELAAFYKVEIPVELQLIGQYQAFPARLRQWGFEFNAAVGQPEAHHRTRVIGAAGNARQCP